jgi:hypothetical protein
LPAPTMLPTWLSAVRSAKESRHERNGGMLRRAVTVSSVKLARNVDLGRAPGYEGPSISLLASRGDPFTYGADLEASSDLGVDRARQSIAALRRPPDYVGGHHSVLRLGLGNLPFLKLHCKLPDRVSDTGIIN